MLQRARFLKTIQTVQTVSRNCLFRSLSTNELSKITQHLKDTVERLEQDLQLLETVSIDLRNDVKQDVENLKCDIRALEYQIEKVYEEDDDYPDILELNH